MGIEFRDYCKIVSIDDLTPGTAINIGPLKRMGDFVRHMAGAISGQECPVIIPFHHVGRGVFNITMEEIIEKEARRKKCPGARLGSSRTIVLSTDPSWIKESFPKPSKPVDPSQLSGTSFLTATEVYGRPSLKKEILLLGDPQNSGRVLFLVRSIKPDKIEAAIGRTDKRYVEALRVGLEELRLLKAS
ncbi:hypothetical protein HYU45_03840 [Candidatus Daviesbacteria bacterium]|nr:hypothetical protein [Candidatus Daviesbacteria bacterium]